MRVMVFGMAQEGAPMGASPAPEAFAEMDRFNEALVEAGVFVAAAGLHPTSAGRRIVCEGDERLVTEGPFTETHEVVVGFSIWEVKDMDEAVAWARRSPNPLGRAVIEIRPFLEAYDLADDLPPEDLAAPRDGDRGKLGVA
jgi:hypothetical protein